MENKKQIIELYYSKHLKVKEISNLLNISSPYITKIIKQDNRYDNEKSYRKNINIQNRKIAKNQFMKNKREKKKIDDNYSTVLSQHNQAVRELSKGRYLNNESYRKWNYSAYNYNPSKKRYEFNDTLGRSADVPKYIKER